MKAKNTGLKLLFDRRLRLEFRGAKITTDAGLLAVRELDEMIDVTEMAADLIVEGRTGKKIQHKIPGLLRQSVSFDKAVKVFRIPWLFPFLVSYPFFVKMSVVACSAFGSFSLNLSVLSELIKLNLPLSEMRRWRSRLKLRLDELKRAHTDYEISSTTNIVP